MQIPTPQDIANARASLAGRVIRTPTVQLSHDRFAGQLPEGADVRMKLELFQHAGSFKSRGALLNIDALPDGTRGVTAASGGNHALAVAWAAKAAGVSAHIAMPDHVDPVRIDGCRALGATLTLVSDIAEVFPAMERIAAEESRVPVHPFEGRLTSLGTATVGAELMEDVPDLDMAIVPVGGGGLISGMSVAIKQANPTCQVIGVEPEGADSLSRSLDAGAPVTLDKVDTIADSLGAPMALPYSFGLARAHVDRMIRLPDQALTDAMHLMLGAMHITPEPACAAALAALIGPLRDEAAGRRCGILACGSNIGLPRFQALTTRS